MASTVDASVIFATRDRSSLLAQTLAHLRRQTGAPRWELIVVDNGSTDETPSVLAGAAAELPLHLLHEPAAGKK